MLFRSYKLGNGINGWEEKILFDANIVSAASEEITSKLLQNLKNNGKLIIQMKYSFENQKLILVKKKNENNYEKEKLFDVKFLPHLDKIGTLSSRSSNNMNVISFFYL